MSYSYQPRDPRSKLRQVAVKWVSAMRVTGHAPNRDIVFADDSPLPLLTFVAFWWTIGGRKLPRSAI